MHILIGILTAVAGVIWALYRLQNSGVDLNSFNPFYWARRRKWEKQLGTKAIHRLENPMESAALLVVASAQLEGEITREHKAEIVTLFKSEFGINEQAAVEYYALSSHMLREVMDIAAEVKHILAPSMKQYQSHHKASLLKMLKTVTAAEGEPNSEQIELINAVELQFDKTEDIERTW